MQILQRALRLFGMGMPQGPAVLHVNYELLMDDALQRVRLAELQIREATTLEDLDIGRSRLLAAWAEVQQLVRTAKRERGIEVRPLAESEETHRRLRASFSRKNPERAADRAPVRRRPATGH